MKKIITEEELALGIQKGLRIGLNCYTPVSSFLKNLETVLRLVLKQYEKPDLLPTIFGVVQELISFSCTSNMRFVFYEKNGHSLDSKEKFLELEPLFLKEVGSSSRSYSFREELIKRKMNIQTIIEHNDIALNIKVYNKSEHQLDQEFFIRDYLRKAMQYTDVNQYFEDHPEDNQGKNMGLAFSVILLKEAGLRPDLMRFGKPGAGGHSRIEIPFVVEYKSIRDRILNDEPLVPFEKPNLIPPQFLEQYEERKKITGPYPALELETID
jgi:hypothetical protein